MAKEDAIEKLAAYYGNEDDLDWERGCFLNGRWLSLQDVISVLFDEI